MKSGKTFSPLLILLLFFTAASSNLNAQKKKKTNNNKGRPGTVIYEIESNDPANARNLSITASPFYFDSYTLNMNMGYFGEVNYRLNNRWELNGFYRGSYLDRFETSTGNAGMAHGYSDDEKKGVRTFGGSLTFYFKDDLSVKMEDVTVKSHTNGSTTTHYVIELPARRLRLFGIRAGYEMFNSSVFSRNNYIHYSGTLLSTDTSVYVNDLSHGKYSTYARTGIFSVGLCRTRIYDLHINTEKYGKKALASVSEIYVDVLFNTGTTLSDMNVVYRNASGAYDGSIYYPYEVTSPLSKVGFRAGFMEHANLKFRALGMFGVEIGTRPGPKSPFENIYVMLKFGMNLSMKAGSSRSLDDELEDPE